MIAVFFFCSDFIAVGACVAHMHLFHVDNVCYSLMHTFTVVIACSWISGHLVCFLHVAGCSMLHICGLECEMFRHIFLKFLYYL